MFDIFEQPWTLTGAAVIVLFGILTFRSVLPEKQRWWQLLFPVFIFIAAFAFDVAVKTDLEKINSVIKISMKAIQEEDLNILETTIAEDYSDSYHDSKIHLLNHCRQRLQSNQVQKIKKTSCLINLSPPNATAIIFTTITFEKDSFIAQNYKPFLFSKVELSFKKQYDKTWLINRAEILELDRQSVSWRQIR